MPTSQFFRVVEHLIEAQHIREYPAATATSQEEPLKLHIRQYAPNEPLEAPEDAVTIIGAHANGFPKVGTFSFKRRQLTQKGTLRALVGGDRLSSSKQWL